MGDSWESDKTWMETDQEANLSLSFSKLDAERRREHFLMQEEFERKLSKYIEFVRHCKQNFPEVYFSFVMEKGIDL